MTINELLLDCFARIDDEFPGLIADLTADQLLWTPVGQVNHMAWLCWHIGRCEDEQIAQITGEQSVYLAQGWDRRFALPYPGHDLGYGHTPEQVRAFRLDSPALLSGYYHAVAARTRDYLAGLTEADLDAPIPNDPYQASVGVRLVSIINDITQHLGQVAYLRGMVPQTGPDTEEDR